MDGVVHYLVDIMGFNDAIKAGVEIIQELYNLHGRAQ
jgi:hypothetical protein